MRVTETRKLAEQAWPRRRSVRAMHGSPKVRGASFRARPFALPGFSHVQVHEGMTILMDRWPLDLVPRLTLGMIASQPATQACG